MQSRYSNSAVTLLGHSARSSAIKLLHKRSAMKNHPLKDHKQAAEFSLKLT